MSSESLRGALVLPLSSGGSAKIASELQKRVRNVRQKTPPAMSAGITDHGWTMHEWGDVSGAGTPRHVAPAWWYSGL